jgi:group I intron endonuclease
MGQIYKITNIITNEIYVGKTINDINERFKQHIRNGRKIDGASKICKSLREYGSRNHIIETLESCDNVDTILHREQHWIDELNTLHNGLNIKNEKIHSEFEYWGDPEIAFKNIENGITWNKGISPKDDTRKKISNTKKKRQELGLYKDSYGHSHSDETKKKLSEIAKKRRPVSVDTREKISECSKDRKFFYNVNDKKRICIKKNEPVPSGYVSGKGMIWMKKKDVSISVSIWEKLQYIESGYEEGR